MFTLFFLWKVLFRFENCCNFQEQCCLWHFVTCLFLTRPIPQHFTDFVNQVQLHVLDQGNYTEWTNWSECSATCGGGAQIRSRTCTNPPPKAGGKDCKETIGPAEESRQCDTGPCRKCCNFYFDEIVFKQLLTSNSFPFCSLFIFRNKTEGEKNETWIWHTNTDIGPI